MSAQSVTLEQASLSLGTARPSASATWRPVTLPYKFTADDYTISRHGWFRLILPAAGFEQPALLFPKINMNIEVFLDGALVFSGGSFSEPVTRNWNRPLMFSLPSGTGQEQTLLVHLVSYAPYGQLGVVEYGEQSTLQPAYRRIHWNNNGITEIMFYVTCAAGLWGLMLWLQRRKDTINLWYGLTAICWSLYSLNLFIENIPVSAHVWDSIQFSSLDFVAVLMTGFIHRLLRLQRPVLEKCLWIYAVSGLLVNLMLDTATMNLVTAFWHAGAVSLIFYMTWLVIRHFRELDDLSRWALSLFFFTSSLVSIHDFLYQNGAEFVLPWRLFPYPAPILLLFFFWLLVKRFVMAMNEAESLSHELDERVEENRIELEHSYRELQEAETHQVIEQERQSIENRFHQEVGGTLRLLARSQQSKVSGAIGTVIRDLELALNNNLPSQGLLRQKLQQWRDNTAHRLDKAGTRFHWHANDIPEELMLTRVQYAHLNRILNEAVSNAIKHGHAEQITVVWEYKDGTLELRVENFGKPSSLTIQPGRGVKGMQARADTLGGDIRWYPSSTGYLVLLKFPCYHPATTGQPSLT